MKAIGLIVLLLVSGCAWGSGPQARFLSGSDTKQAIALEEAQDPKMCEWLRGQGSGYGVEGYAERVVARGRNVSMQDCITLFNKTVNPIVLPASRPPVARPLPPEAQP